MPSLPSRRGLLGGVAAGVLSVATGWLEPLQSDNTPNAKDALAVSVVNDHALSHEVSVRVGREESAVEATASVDGTTSRDLASILPEVSDAEGESGAERYEVVVAVDDRRRVSTTVAQGVNSITVRIDVIGTVEIERERYAG
jgi:uncharacterized protein YqgV (UPF0045/DUF77 family)